MVNDSEKNNTTNTIAHLGFIQDVISRMAGNSLAIKGASVAIITAVITVIAALQKSNCYFLVGAGLPVVLLWLLDAKYLRLERQYRKMYDAVRTQKAKADFSMNPHKFSGDVSGVFRIAFSWSVIWFYLALVATLLVVAYIV